MPYLELSLRCSESDQPRYENALEDVGALAVTLLDADADTGNEQGFERGEDDGEGAIHTESTLPARMAVARAHRRHPPSSARRSHPK